MSYHLPFMDIHLHHVRDVMTIDKDYKQQKLNSITLELDLVIMMS